MRPAALMRGAMRKATSKPVRAFAAGSSWAAAKRARRSDAYGAAKFAKPERGDDAVLANKRHGIRDGCDGSHFEEAGQYFVSRTHRVVALQQGLRQFERDGGAAERFFGIAAGRLVGIEDGERSGQRIVGRCEDDGR